MIQVLNDLPLETDLPLATDEECIERREYLIKHGIIIPPNGTEKTKRQELIDSGIISPKI